MQQNYCLYGKQLPRKFCTVKKVKYSITYFCFAYMVVKVHWTEHISCLTSLWLLPQNILVWLNKNEKKWELTECEGYKWGSALISLWQLMEK